MPAPIEGTKFRLKSVKLHSEVDAIRLCLASLEKQAQKEGYELAAICLKAAQLFLKNEYYTKQDS